MNGGLRQMWRRLLAMFRAPALDRDLQDELASHLQLAADDYASRGLSADDARRKAAIKLGAIGAAQGRHRDARGLPSVESFLKDLGYALRGFRREPGFTLIAVMILALGIGANTAVFSVINPLLLRPLPFPDSERLTWLTRTQPNQQGDGDMSSTTFRVASYEELLRQNQSFEDVSAYMAFFGFANYTLTGRGEPERIVGVDVAPRFFDVLRVQPMLGRVFLTSEHQSKIPPAIILSHAFWQRRFAADPSIVGQTLNINDRQITVAGVMPADFDFSSTFTPGVRVDFFLPLNVDIIRNYGHTLAIVGRLKPGVSVDSARAEIDQLMPRIGAMSPNYGPLAARIMPLKEFISGRMRRSLTVLWGAVGLVLLIVCANLSNLLLARTSARSKEIAVRMALGAGRARVIRQLLTEGIVLALAGASLGVPLAYGLTMYLSRGAAVSLPLLNHVRVDGAALAFTAVIAIVAGVLFGTIPAIRISGRDPHTALKEQNRGSTEGRGHAWVRSALVVAEVTLACVLLVGAGLLLRSFVQLLDVDLGFQPSRALAVHVQAMGRPTGPQQLALLEETVRQLRTVPGVEAAGSTDALPLDRNRSWGLAVPGHPNDPKSYSEAFVFIIGPGYLSAMGIPIKSGRDFSEADDRPTSQPAVIINETLARRLWPNEDPIGKLANGDPKKPYRIVGIVGNVRQTGLDEEPVAQMYVAQAQQGEIAADVILRTSLPPASLVASVRAKLQSFNTSITATDFRPIDTLVDRALSPRRFLVTLLGGFSLLALALACLGIYGVVSYGVSQRVQEIGVRMALGATAADVSRQVIAGTLKLALIGIALGLALSLGLARLIATLLYGTSATDAATFSGTAVTLTIVALAASAIPALRAARIDPMSALRAD